MEIATDPSAAEAQPTICQTAPHRIATLLRLCAASFGNTPEPRGDVDWNDVQDVARRSG